MSDVPALLPPQDFSYSTRTCRRCSTGMTPSSGPRGQRRWTCPDCGATTR